MATITRIADGVTSENFSLDNKVVRIGRAPDNDIHIDETTVSNRHAEIIASEDPLLPDHISYLIKDLDSTNHTYVNQREVKEHRLNHNDIIKIGWTTFKFIDQTQCTFETTAYMLTEDHT